MLDVYKNMKLNQFLNSKFIYPSSPSFSSNLTLVKYSMNTNTWLKLQALTIANVQVIPKSRKPRLPQTESCVTCSFFCTLGSV